LLEENSNSKDGGGSIVSVQRRKVLVAGLAAATTAMSEPARAQPFPSKPIRFIVPFAAGGNADVTARIVGEGMSRKLGQAIIVDNRPGAGGNMGTAMVAKAVPDGYMLVASGSGPVAANKTLYRDLGYDPEKDLTPISPFAAFTIVIVASTKLPVNTLAELIAYAKAHPNVLNYGSVGIGSSQHLGGAYFEQLTGTQLTHVPYRNIAQYGPDLMSGTVQLGFQWLPNVSGALASGGAKALAVAGKSRLAALPDVPTTAEAGLPEYQASGWFAMLAPRDTPKPIVARINQALAAAIADPTVRERFSQQGAEPMAVSPEDAAKFISAETAKWRDIIGKAAIPLID
jgi:tripartite-type tricarboxylate transporter receptor subunit TctC